MRRILFLIFAATALLSCSGNGNTDKKKTDTIKSSDAVKAADVTEVLYFHGKKRCITCNAIERLTKEVVDSLGDAKIVMRIIDITKDEVTADKYEVAWSSLILESNGKVMNLTDMGFGFAKNQPAEFKNRLTRAIKMIAE